MKFRAVNPNRAVSDCGNYAVCGALTMGGHKFYNAWHLPTNKHFAASYEKRVVIAACEHHAAESTAAQIGAT